MRTVPITYPQECREDMVWVIRFREDGVTIGSMTKDCCAPRGYCPNEPVKPISTTATNLAKPAASRLRRVGPHADSALEYENKALRRAVAYLWQTRLRERALPLVKGLDDNGVPAIPGGHSPPLLSVAQTSGHQDRAGQGVSHQPAAERPLRSPCVLLPAPGPRSRRDRRSGVRVNGVSGLPRQLVASTLR